MCLNFGILLSILSLVYCEEIHSEPLTSESVVRLKQFDVPISEDINETVLRKVVPSMTGYIFQYKKGKRIPGDELLLGDTKSWKFPKQDISLEFEYEKEEVFDPQKNTYMDLPFYLTQFRVFISQDSNRSQGYLTSGGPGDSHLNLKFVASEVELLSYDIKLYGIHCEDKCDPIIFNVEEED